MNDKADLDNLLEKKLDEPRLREQKERENRESIKEIEKKQKETIRNFMYQENIIDRVESIVEWMNKNLIVFGSFKISKSKFSNKHPGNYPCYELIISRRHFLFYRKVIEIKIILDDQCSNVIRKSITPYLYGYLLKGIIADCDMLRLYMTEMSLPKTNKKILSFWFKSNLEAGCSASALDEVDHLRTDEFFDYFKYFLVKVKGYQML